MKLSLILPCYNEGVGLTALLKRLKAVSLECSDIEFVLVDNGSSDDTVELVRNASADNSSIHPVRVEVNQGYGYGILQGLKVATGDYLGWTHADMQTNPADVLKALSILDKETDSSQLYIKGKRYARPMFDKVFTFGMNTVETLLFQRLLFDINAQPNIFPRSFYDGWKNPPYDFSLDLFAYVMAIRQGLKVVRFPVLFDERRYGTSHWNINWQDKAQLIMRTVGYSFRLRKTW
jgi:glycosyltransferase involved in cell wall biosynthesis